MRKEIYWDNCVLKTQYQLSIMNGGKEAGGGGQWCNHEFTKNNLVSFMSHKINGVFDLGHMFG